MAILNWFGIPTKEQRQIADNCKRMVDDFSLQSAIVSYYEEHEEVSLTTIINGKPVIDQLPDTGLTIDPVFIIVRGEPKTFEARFTKVGFSLHVY